MAAFKLFCCFNSVRNIGSFFASLRFCSFIVYLFKWCFKYASL